MILPLLNMGRATAFIVIWSKCSALIQGVYILMVLFFVHRFYMVFILYHDWFWVFLEILRNYTYFMYVSSG